MHRHSPITANTLRISKINKRRPSHQTATRGAINSLMGEASWHRPMKINVSVYFGFGGIAIRCILRAVCSGGIFMPAEHLITAAI